MPRYIDADAATEYLRSTYCQGCGDIYNGVICRSCALDGALYYLDDLPADDVVEVVRCKDCIHAEVDRMCDTDEIYCDCYGIYKCADGFCDDGKREDQE